MNLQESESERIVAQVKPGTAPYIAHDLYRLFSGKGCTVAYTDTTVEGNTVEISGEYITVEVEAWLRACEHVTAFDRQRVNEVMEEPVTEDIAVGDVVRIEATGKVESIDSNGGCVVTLHGVDVPVLLSACQKASN